MAVPLLAKGIFLGFTVAAAVGPISLLCVQRTLARGWKYGLVSGLGVATADGLYGLIGGLGLTVVTNFLVGQERWLRFGGGLVLIYMGLKSLFASQAQAAQEKQVGAGGYLGAYSSIFLLTLSNPMTIIFFTGIYAGAGLTGVNAAWGLVLVFTLGIFGGSVLWWLVLTGGVHLLRARFDQRVLNILGRVSGLVIAGFGVFVLLE